LRFCLSVYFDLSPRGMMLLPCDPRRGFRRLPSVAAGPKRRSR
jgi:hypothetical protein